MTKDQALQWANQITAARPNLVLCGSAAMVLAKLIPDREIADLDFVAHEEGFDPEGLSLYGGYPPFSNGDDNYFTYKVQGDPHTDMYYNIFVFKEKPRTVVIEHSAGPLIIQDPEDMLAWKKKYDRDKDRKDLGISRPTIKQNTDYIPW